MSADIGERGLLGGLMAREIAMRRAVVDVTTVVGAGNGIIDVQHLTQQHRQPLRRASDALPLLTAPAGQNELRVRFGLHTGLREPRRAACISSGLREWKLLLANENTVISSESRALRWVGCGPGAQLSTLRRSYGRDSEIVGCWCEELDRRGAVHVAAEDRVVADALFVFSGRCDV